MKEFFTQNRANFFNTLQPREMLILFSGTAPKSTADSTYSFLPNKNFFYMTGLTKENFTLVIQKTSEEKLETILFIEKPNYDVEKWYGRKLTAEDATKISGIETIKYEDEFENWLNGQIYKNKVSKLHLDLEKVSVSDDPSIAQKFAKKLHEEYIFLSIETAHPVISDLRTIKTDFEIDKVQKAIDLTKAGLESIMNGLKPGMTEYQLETIFSHSIRMNGADGNSFPTIAASGADAVILHYVDNAKVLENNTMVLLDLGAQYQQYAADITRTFPVNGKFTDRQKEIYNIVLKAQQAVIDAIKPELPMEELNKICKKVISEELLRIGVMKTEDDLGKYYYHGVSHYLGLDVHDLGNYERTIQPGMILTVEPGIYIAEEEIGIRIEDDVLVTDTGCKNLSFEIIKTTDEIEAFMAKGEKV